MFFKIATTMLLSGVFATSVLGQSCVGCFPGQVIGPVYAPVHAPVYMPVAAPVAPTVEFKYYRNEPTQQVREMVRVKLKDGHVTTVPRINGVLPQVTSTISGGVRHLYLDYAKAPRTAPVYSRTYEGAETGTPEAPVRRPIESVESRKPRTYEGVSPVRPKAEAVQRRPSHDTYQLFDVDRTEGKRQYEGESSVSPSWFSR